MKKYFGIIAASLAITSCNNQKTPAVNVTTQHVVYASSPDTGKVKYTAAMVDNKKDFVCGMPVTAGIGDTCHYNGKVYGFCSKECKDEFLKNPLAYLSKEKK